MKSLFFTLIIMGLATIVWGQEIHLLSDMLVATSNNAVASAKVDSKFYVYSFAGIDSTKTYQGIHKHSYKYDIDNDIWSQLPDLPTGNGRIAASASMVKNKIYIIGGYEVLSSGNEISYDNVHVFDPSTDQFMADASPIPIPIDDHVQAVYKDSLIFVVTGWSNTTNVPNVQIYNPSLDEWTIGTSVPSSIAYKVFGATGQIIGDTLYYLGGAYYGTNFPLSNRLRKGYINPENPSDISWTSESDDLFKRYRAASLVRDEQLLWFGGSSTSYNYNAIAYNGSGIVVPDNSILRYDGRQAVRLSESGPEIMDIRSIANLGSNKYIVAGGMTTDGKVSKFTYLIDFTILDNVFQERENSKIDIFPNPTPDVIFLKDRKGIVSIYDVYGKLVWYKNLPDDTIIDVSDLPNGIYLLQLLEENQRYHSMFVKEN